MNEFIEIANEGQKNYSDKAIVKNLAGRYVLAGFIDMHVHLAPDARYGNRHWYHRHAGAMPGAGVKLRGKIVSGELIGLRMITAGLFIDFQSHPNGAGVVVKTENEIRREVRLQEKYGVGAKVRTRGELIHLVVRG